MSVLDCQKKRHECSAPTWKVKPNINYETMVHLARKAAILGLLQQRKISVFSRPVKHLAGYVNSGRF